MRKIVFVLVTVFLLLGVVSASESDALLRQQSTHINLYGVWRNTRLCGELCVHEQYM